MISQLIKIVMTSEVSRIAAGFFDFVQSKLPPVDHKCREVTIPHLCARAVMIIRMSGRLVYDICLFEVSKQKVLISNE